jgi:signal transduction histidine kinase
MNRPLHIWSIFAVCAAVLLGVVTWVTATALRLEQAQGNAQRQAEFEEKVRLALWRMDSLLTALIVEESARPAAQYKPFRSISPRAAKSGLPAPGRIFPSPLLAASAPHVLLYFEMETNGVVTSPAVGLPENRPALMRYTTTQNVETAAARLAEFKKILSEPAASQTRYDLTVGAHDNGRLLFTAATSPGTNDLPIALTNSLLAANQVLESAAQMPQALNFKPEAWAQQQERVQSLRSSVEYQARANALQQVAGANSSYGNQAARPVQTVNTPSTLPSDFGTDLDGAAPAAVGSPMTPLWLGSALVLARRVDSGQGPVIQGAWLNWDELERTLLANIQDLFPRADLRAATRAGETPGSRTLAVVPADFAPNAEPLRDSFVWSPTRVTLALAWVCMLIVVIAVAVLLYAAVSLSERRGAFVSAVTHELRTPLTTFKMYSEMLADGMVPEETKRQQYLATLCSEANRLSHLVENVLAYARLERGSARTRVERISLGDLIERILPRLRERAERSEMKLIVDADGLALGTVVHVDAAAVEQILFNLVDNACKYAAPSSSEKVIHLEALPDGKFAMLRVRDHGQGISVESAKRLFKAFSKSAQEAAHSAPGIGLGLALCRRLSRSLGGDLRFVRNATRGACFELRLPLDTSGAAALNSI